MSLTLTELVEAGKAELKKKNRLAAHKYFLEAYTLDSTNVSVLLFLALSSQYKEEAEQFLFQAKDIDPSNPHVIKGLEWSKKLPIKKNIIRTRSSRKTRKIPKVYAFVGVGLIFCLCLGLGVLASNSKRIFPFSKNGPLEISTPGTQISGAGAVTSEISIGVDQNQVGDTQVIRALPPTWTPRPSSTNQYTNTFTPTIEPTITPEIFTPTAKILEINGENYPVVNLDDFFPNPERYQDMRISLSGEIVEAGMLTIGVDPEFIIQMTLGKKNGKDNQILIRGFIQSPDFKKGGKILVYGTAMGTKTGKFLGGLEGQIPVVLGEKYESEE